MIPAADVVLKRKAWRNAGAHALHHAG